MSTDISSNDSLLKELENLNQTLSNTLRREVSETIVAEVSAEVPVNTINVSLSTTNMPPLTSFKLNDENLSDFIFENSQKLVKHSLETIEELKYIVKGSADGDTMAGFASIVKATSSALDTLNALNLERQKSKTAKEIKLMDLEGRKQIAKSQKPNQTLNLIAPREEIMRMLEDFEKKKQLNPAIDAEYIEVDSKTSETPKIPQSQPV